MGRLVDIDAVIKAVDKHTKDESEIVLDNDITCILEEVPTAYDVEKVVAELEEKELLNSSAQAEAQIGMCGNLANYYCGNKDAYNNAIDIVRKGGVE